MEQIFLKDFILTARILQQKDMLNIGFGSISLKTGNDTMIINRKNTCILDENFYIQVNINHKTLAYKEANEDVSLHARIYKEISFAKTIFNINLSNVIAYSIIHKKFQPIDVNGKKYFNKLEIIDDESEKNINSLVETLMKNEIAIIKAKSIIIISRDIKEALKKAFILNNSAKILLKIPH